MRFRSYDIDKSLAYAPHAEAGRTMSVWRKRPDFFHEDLCTHDIARNEC